jgi:hypothetical protein
MRKLVREPGPGFLSRVMGQVLLPHFIDGPFWIWEGLKGSSMIVELSVCHVSRICMGVIPTRWCISATVCWDQTPSLSLFIPRFVLINKMWVISSKNHLWGFVGCVWVGCDDCVYSRNMGS